jgi:hypothetical protein
VERIAKDKQWKHCGKEKHMTPTHWIYPLIAMSFLIGILLTLASAWIWLYATEYLMEKFNVTDPLDKYRPYRELFGTKGTN